LGYREGETVCLVTVGGSGVGGSLIRRILAAYPIAKRLIPDLCMIVVTGPRLDPAGFDLPAGVEARAFVPDPEAPGGLRLSPRSRRADDHGGARCRRDALSLLPAEQPFRA